MSDDLWIPSSEKKRLEDLVAKLQEQLRERSREDVHWRTEYLVLRDRVENPHLYDAKGSPTPEALELKGGPIYGAPLVKPQDRRRVVTIQERMLELASAFYHRSHSNSLDKATREAWTRAYIELISLRYHGMSRPDLPLCLKCGGTADAFPTKMELVLRSDSDGKDKRLQQKVRRKKPCTCENGFDPDADINDIIND